MNQTAMNDYYFNFIKQKMKRDIISKLKNDNIKNIENINEIIEKVSQL